MDQGSPLLRLATNVKLFAGIPMGVLGKLVQMSDKVPIFEGGTFFNEGDFGESFYILVSGHVAVEQTKGGKWIQLALLHPGDSFGEMTLVDDKVRSARVRATVDSVALFFPIQRLKTDHEVLSCLYHNIAKVLVKRLKSTNNVVLDLSAKLAHDEPEPTEAPSEAPTAAPAAVEEVGIALDAPPVAVAAAASATFVMDEIPELKLPGSRRF